MSTPTKHKPAREHSPFVAPPGQKQQLKDHDPAGTGRFSREDEAEQPIRSCHERLAKYQDMLLAQESHALLILFQGMDGSGKDEAIQDVLSGLNPQGCRAQSFQKPAGEELKHDYLWRFVRKLPERGQIGIFNRSYYEEVLSTRVHPERLEEQRLPASIRDAQDLWRQRFAQINHFEQYLVQNGMLVVKFFLHVSEGKQKERLRERLDLPEKQWQFSMDDIEERKRWSKYQEAYEEVLTFTSTEWAPWYIIPANHRWFSALSVVEVVAARLEGLGLRYPRADQKQVARAREILERDERI